MLIMVLSISLGLCLVAIAILAVLDGLGERWGRLPQFVFNYVGGKLAVCSITDFKRGQKLYRDKIGLVVVSQTLRFGWSSGDSRNSGIIRDGPYYKRSQTPKDGDFYPMIQNQELFVPFISESVLSYERQHQIFTRPRDINAFVLQKRTENEEADLRLRFSAWTKRHNMKFSNWRWVLGIVAVFLFIVMGVVAIAESDKENDERPVVVYMTGENGEIKNIETTNKNRHTLMMYQDYHMNNVMKGAVSRTLYIGGGLYRVCTTWGPKGERCGVSDRDYSPGVIVYLREGMHLWWHSGTVLNYHHTPDIWVISKEEAQALVDKAGFKMEE